MKPKSATPSRPSRSAHAMPVGPNPGPVPRPTVDDPDLDPDRDPDMQPDVIEPQDFPPLPPIDLPPPVPEPRPM